MRPYFLFVSAEKSGAYRVKFIFDILPPMVLPGMLGMLSRRIGGITEFPLFYNEPICYPDYKFISIVLKFLPAIRLPPGFILFSLAVCWMWVF